MRLFLKILGYTLLGIVVIAAVALGGIYWASSARFHNKYDVTVRTIAIPADADAIERGKHIVKTRGCAECHGADLGGNQVIENPLIGTVHGSNITRGKGSVTTAFTDEDWIRAIRHGVAHDKRPLFLMPSAEYAHFTDDDLACTIAYAKSVPPVDRPTVPVNLRPLGRFLLVNGTMKLSADEIDHANLKPEAVKPGPTVEYGRYLAIGCIGCHGANYSGGKIPGVPPDWPPSENLTPHPAGSFSKWSENDFYTAMRTARKPDGVELSPVMPRMVAEMTDEELKAIWLFLKTLPPAPTGVH